MYKCLNCGAVFEEPAVTYETHGLDRPPYEKVYVCPVCRDNYMEEVDDELAECDE